MEKDSVVENFKKTSVLAVCAAGSDRSVYIAQVLNIRGYFATNAGVINGHNYITPDDLSSVGIVVFSSIHEKKVFDRDKKLRSIVERNNIQIRVLNISENDKDRAHSSGGVERLKAEISIQLDSIGLKDLNEIKD